MILQNIKLKIYEWSTKLHVPNIVLKHIKSQNPKIKKKIKPKRKHISAKKSDCDRETREGDDVSPFEIIYPTLLQKISGKSKQRTSKKIE